MRETLTPGQLADVIRFVSFATAEFTWRVRRSTIRRLAEVGWEQHRTGLEFMPYSYSKDGQELQYIVHPENWYLFLIIVSRFPLEENEKPRAMFSIINEKNQSTVRLEVSNSQRDFEPLIPELLSPLADALVSGLLGKEKHA